MRMEANLGQNLEAMKCVIIQNAYGKVLCSKTRMVQCFVLASMHVFIYVYHIEKTHWNHNDFKTHETT